MVYFRDVREQGDTADIWIQLFSSKLHDEPHFRELQKNTTNEVIYIKYHSNKLSK